MNQYLNALRFRFATATDPVTDNPALQSVIDRCKRPEARRTLGTVLWNLTRVARFHSEMPYLRISLHRHYWTGTTISHTVLKKLQKQLLEAGLITVKEGVSNHSIWGGYQTRWGLTPEGLETFLSLKLSNVTMIHPKELRIKNAGIDKKAAREDVENFGIEDVAVSNQKSALATNIFRINQVNQTHRITLSAELLAKHRKRNFHFLDDVLLELSNSDSDNLTPYVRYHRTFNSGDLTLGGRFYSEIQNLPEPAREQIQIDGEAVVELDFAALYPTMLYHLEGAAAPEEVYACPEYGPEHKRTLKALLLCAINTAKPAKTRGTGLRNVVKAVQLDWDTDRNGPCPSYETLKPMLESILAVHPTIEKYFFQPNSLRLQNLDSQIAEKVMLHFIAKGEAIISIHDSVIVRASLAAELREVMIKSYQDVLQTEYLPKIKGTSTMPRANADHYSDPRLTPTAKTFWEAPESHAWFYLDTTPTPRETPPAYQVPTPKPVEQPRPTLPIPSPTPPAPEAPDNDHLKIKLYQLLNSKERIDRPSTTTQAWVRARKAQTHFPELAALSEQAIGETIKRFFEEVSR